MDTEEGMAMGWFHGPSWSYGGVAGCRCFYVSVEKMIYEVSPHFGRPVRIDYGIHTHDS